MSNTDSRMRKDAGTHYLGLALVVISEEMPIKIVTAKYA